MLGNVNLIRANIELFGESSICTQCFSLPLPKEAIYLVISLPLASFADDNAFWKEANYYTRCKVKEEIRDPAKKSIVKILKKCR